MSKHQGNPDSKYAYHPEQLEADIVTKNKQHRDFIDLIKGLVLENPSVADMRYLDVIEALKELKEEYGM